MHLLTSLVNSLALTVFLVLMFNRKFSFLEKRDFIKKSFWFTGALFVFVFCFSFNSTIVSRILNFSTDESSIKRISIFRDAYVQFLSNPLTGTHFLVVSSKMYSHNIFFDILLSTGIFGFLFIIPALLVYLIVIIRSKFKSLIVIISFFFCIYLLCDSNILISFGISLHFYLCLLSF